MEEQIYEMKYELCMLYILQDDTIRNMCIEAESEHIIQFKRKESFKLVVNSYF